MALDRRNREQMPCGCEMRLGHESISWTRCALHEAAPDLLAALRALMDTCPADPDTTDRFYAAWEQAGAAVRKAEGR